MNTDDLVKAGGAVIAVYFGSYFALLFPDERPDMFTFILCGAPPPTTRHVDRVPCYRVGGEISKSVFRPLSWIDEKVRPGYWHFEEKLGSTMTGAGGISGSLGAGGFGGSMPTDAMDVEVMADEVNLSIGGETYDASSEASPSNDLEPQSIAD